MISAEQIAEHNLSTEEYERILEILGREPNLVELGIFSAMWSEHCSYKSSRVHLKTFPTSGPRVLQGPGENAGVVDIGDGLAVAFKMESHNHPSYIEPYQGAATGVGGILRDIFTMGARPIASLDSLRFGSLSAPRMKHLVDGVVRGIAGYGNCIGIPTVGGETTFHPAYDGNILVNVMNVGVLPKDKIFRGRAEGAGNPVVYVGSKTGRDGIHGATMASEEFAGDETRQKRPTVQVGDPFTEKLLMEACLELFQTDAVVGIQDMGAAGLTSSSFEMAGRAGSGVEIDLSKVPVREKGMTPYEILLSESQERMLLVARRNRLKEVLEIFRKWELDAVEIGKVTKSGRVVLFFDGEIVADLPAAPLSDQAPLYDRPRTAPTPAARGRWVSEPEPSDFGDCLRRILASPNVAQKSWIWTQYDHMVGTNTVQRPGGDAALVRVKGTTKALALKSDVNPFFCALDPYRGGAIAVAEAARSIACTGARPLAITDCLNFGNPEKPEVMGQFEAAVRGIADACRALEIPVVSGQRLLLQRDRRPRDPADPDGRHGGAPRGRREEGAPSVSARGGHRGPPRRVARRARGLGVPPVDPRARRGTLPGGGPPRRAPTRGPARDARGEGRPRLGPRRLRRRTRGRARGMRDGAGDRGRRHARGIGRAAVGPPLRREHGARGRDVRAGGAGRRRRRRQEGGRPARSDRARRRRSAPDLDRRPPLRQRGRRGPRGDLEDLFRGLHGSRGRPVGGVAAGPQLYQH